MLNITKEQFTIGYNLDFTPYIEADYTGITYLPWSNAVVLLKQNFPNLQVVFDQPSKIINDAVSNKDLSDIIQSKREEEAKVVDKKLKKKLTSEIKELEETLIYENRGIALNPYLVDVSNGERSPSLFFPVMDSTNRYIASPNARDISDSKMRAAVKCIAWHTGIGLRLWSRENIDLGVKNNNAHPVYKGLIAINKKKDELLAEYGYLPDFWEVPDFGWDVYKLRELHKKLKAYNGDDNKESVESEAEQIISKWTTPAVAIKWAVSQGITEEQAKELFKDFGSNKQSFYELVIAHASM